MSSTQDSSSIESTATSLAPSSSSSWNGGNNNNNNNGFGNTNNNAFYHNLFYILIAILGAFGIVSFVNLVRTRRRRARILDEAERLGLMVPGLPGYVPMRDRATLLQIDGWRMPQWWEVVDEKSQREEGGEGKEEGASGSTGEGMRDGKGKGNEVGDGEDSEKTEPDADHTRETKTGQHTTPPTHGAEHLDGIVEERAPTATANGAAEQTSNAIEGGPSPNPFYNAPHGQESSNANQTLSSTASSSSAVPVLGTYKGVLDADWEDVHPLALIPPQQSQDLNLAKPWSPMPYFPNYVSYPRTLHDPRVKRWGPDGSLPLDELVGNSVEVVVAVRMPAPAPGHAPGAENAGRGSISAPAPLGGLGDDDGEEVVEEWGGLELGVGMVKVTEAGSGNGQGDGGHPAGQGSG